MKQIHVKYPVQINHIIKTIVSLTIKLNSDLVTKRKVVAAQITVKKIVKFLYDFTLNGCTNFQGTKVKIDNKTMTIKFIHSFVFKIKKYNTTTFQTAGKP